jgi:hypothetical protein
MNSPRPTPLPCLLVACLLAWLGVCALAAPAQAQPMGKTAIVPFGVPDGRAALSAADVLENVI